MKKCIVTHAGTFHADELVAIALLRLVYGMADSVISRVYKVSDDQLENEDTFVIDVGKNFNPKKLNFDHHQDPLLPASNILIASWLVEQGRLNQNIFNSLRPVLDYISDVDRGVFPDGSYRFGFNSLIKSFNDANNPNAFFEALDVVMSLMRQQLRVSKEAEESQSRWKALVRVCPGVILSEDTTGPIVGWKGMALREGVKFLVFPNDRGGWNISSSDSNYYPIVEDRRQTFLHNARFIASYFKKEDAISHAVEMVNTNK